MNEPEDTQKENIRDRISKLNSGISWAEERSITIGDEFIRLEVQIATILFTFSGLFLGEFNAETLTFASDELLLVFRLVFAVSLVLLLISLAFGLLHIKTRERFSEMVLEQRILRHKKWREALEGKSGVTFEIAEAFEAGNSSAFNGGAHTLNEPSWTWILQTVCLSIGVIGLFILALIFLFNQ